MATNEVRNTPGASILHLGSHVGSLWLQFFKEDHIELETKKQWSKVLGKGIPYWLMIFLGIKTKCLQTAIEQRNKKITQSVPHELDEFSNADMVISNGGRAPQSPINKYIDNIRCFGKSYHYPFLVIGTFEDNMNFLLTYNSSIYDSKLVDKFDRVLSKIEKEIYLIEESELFNKSSLGAGFTTLKE